MSVLLIAGSPSERSRTAALLSAAGQRLAFRVAQVQTLRVRDLLPQAPWHKKLHAPCALAINKAGSPFSKRVAR